MPTCAPGGRNTIATYRKATLIYNPCAGRLKGGRIGLIKRVVEALSAGGHDVAPVPTKAPGDATLLARAAASEGADLVLSFGGDGTLNETLNGLVNTDVPLAMIPAGTANVLAREMGVGCDPVRVAGMVGELVPRRVSVGLLHTADRAPRYFLLMAGVGFDAHIVYNLNVPLKARVGQFAYWVGAFRELSRKQDEFDVTVGGRTYRCSFALASRVRNYAGWMSIARGVSLLEDRFEFVLCEGRSTLGDYGRYFCAVMAGTASKTRGMHFLYGREAAFECPGGPAVYVQIDGEYAGRLPARVEVVPDALTVLAPPRYAGTR